jgi:hypothetical protein
MSSPLFAPVANSVARSPTKAEGMRSARCTLLKAMLASMSCVPAFCASPRRPAPPPCASFHVYAIAPRRRKQYILRSRTGALVRRIKQADFEQQASAFDVAANQTGYAAGPTLRAETEARWYFGLAFLGARTEDSDCSCAWRRIETAIKRQVIQTTSKKLPPK